MNKYLRRGLKSNELKFIHSDYLNNILNNDFHLIAIPQIEENFYIKEINKWKIIKSFKINYQDLFHTNRVFESLQDKNLIVYLVVDSSPKYVAENHLENYVYSNRLINKKTKKFHEKMNKKLTGFFISKNPREFLEKFVLIFGFNAFQYLNIVGKQLLKLKPLDFPLGTFGWKNFDEFISFANITCDWIIIRNFEFLPLDFFGNDKDLDVLCRNKEVFIKKLNLSKRSWGISSYQVNIDGKKIPLDLRYLGDGYFDKLWQHNMLVNKKFYNDYVPRPCNIDYFYSLIYHSKLQKNKIKEIYFERLYKLQLTLGMNLRKSFIKDDLICSKLLSNFLNLNQYIISKPFDINVKFNIIFYKKINKFLDKIPFIKIPIFIRFVLLIPLPLRNFLLKAKRNFKIFRE